MFSLLVFIFIAMRRDKTWDVDFAELELKQRIGTGGYGAVHKAIWKNNDVAVKLLANTTELTKVLNAALLPDSLAHLLKEMKSNFTEEVKLMTALRHPNVVLFMGACTKPPNLCIIMEYMELGSLYDVLRNEFIPRLPFPLRLKIATQV